MDIYLTLFFIQVILVIITDYSGWTEDLLLPMVKKITGSRVGHLSKIFTCSFCQMHWIGLIYLIVVGAFSLGNYLYVLLLAVLTPTVLLLIHLTVDFINNLINSIYQYFGL